MEQLIAKDEKEYVSKAVSLASDREKFLNLRRSIFLMQLKVHYFDEKKFAEIFLV